ncbi:MULTISPECIES: exopolysaccharide biosynthesis polyprenyl glycosylphosphotransferase [Actinomadura]|uniref:Exopolysaccharide biosynthesis polyprenyl glycosylphosphotransferase n=1 Tax=Actinomadura madurae TaxID=1993 RepID=A0A1I5UB94_9ACTN|nr:exopolysaccharide biosynthesis polyprenyl glycosylphosphotransferase [Actinomadura madurae]SFP92492.1 exopolysaccharide biosynthesis polyprenyl glycosylphosphotransferase [Actinomadura madurae]SPT51930.1 Putative colanic biosynthesis UDP-glucose lipid carrier transferase [Actinomadura madurae]
MRAQGLTSAIEPGAAPPELAAAADGTAVPSGGAGPRLLAGLCPVCLALLDGWAMAAAVTLTRGGFLAGPAALAIMLLNASAGLYRMRRSPSLLADLPPLLVRAALVGAAAAALLADPAAWPWITAVALTLQAGGRACVNAAVRTYRCRRSRARPALVVGTGAMTEHVLEVLRERGEYGLAAVGQVTAGRPPGHPGAAPLLGDTSDLPAIVTEHRIGTLVVVAEDVHPHRLDAVLRVSFGLPCETLLVQPPSDVVPVVPARREYLAGLPCARVGGPLHDPAARRAKRALDVIIAVLVLVPALPLLAVCAAAVRIEGGPGVLFRQRRIGLGGEEFVLLKFRTLKPADEHEADTRWTVKNDGRMGRVGRFLRNTSLDELPQLWNVIRGDMSLVGPRPERPHFVDQFSRTCPGYTLRHRAPAGMTGWAQVHGFRGDTSIELRARLDNHYIDHWSVAADLRILLLTARAMLCRDSG